MYNHIWLKFRFKLNGFIRLVCRFRIKHSKDSRPSSYPFISGDGFRKFADHIFEDENTFNPDQIIEKRVFNAEKVKYGDIVFLDARSINLYFRELHPKITNKYILITHNADVSIGLDEVNLLDDKIIKWFGQNVIVSHPRIIPIPIGLENLYYYKNGIIGYYNKFKNLIKIKKTEILLGFNLNTNLTERTEAFEVLQNNNYCKKIDFKLNSINYLKLLSGYKFVASPPGNGLDCHRTWEAMYLQVVPIVKRSVSTDYFLSIGLPLWVVDSWDEVNNLDKLALDKKYDNLKEKFDSEVLFLNYWLNTIKSVL